MREFNVGSVPFFTWHGDDMIYGFPIYGEVATKIEIDNPGPVVTTETRTCEPDRVRERRVESWLQRYIPGFLSPTLYTNTCICDMPRGRNFVIDAFPNYWQILVCVGAGHAFKFAALLGKILSELAIDGHTDYPIVPFRIQRPAIIDLDFSTVISCLTAAIKPLKMWRTADEPQRPGTGSEQE